MKRQTLEHHFHTPGVGQTRFAAAIDILKIKVGVLHRAHLLRRTAPSVGRRLGYHQRNGNG